MMLAFIPYKMFVCELGFTIEVVVDMQVVHLLLFGLAEQCGNHRLLPVLTDSIL